MKLLVLGGTVFLGRHIVEEALRRGHEITIMHRGQRGADLFENQVERILGDRDGELHKLGNRKWDAVIDTCGYVPRVVCESTDYLKDKVSRYLFVSTISVYNAKERETLNEDSPVKTHLDDPNSEEITGETYGPLKAACERIVEKVYGARGTVVRPGLIVGPHDPTDRFTYWPVRIHEGGEIIAPDRKDQPSQFIDVRDLARLTLDLLEKNASGTFNATGPQDPYTLGEVLLKMKELVNPRARFVWIDPEALEENEVNAWTELPFYLGSEDTEDSMMRVDASRAIAQGLTFTPLETTICDTLEWALSRGKVDLKNGIKRDKERSILTRFVGMVI